MPCHAMVCRVFILPFNSHSIPARTSKTSARTSRSSDNRQSKRKALLNKTRTRLAPPRKQTSNTHDIPHSPHSVSDLLHGTTASAEGSTTLEASTFIDHFSESSPFAEDTLGDSAISSALRTSQSLNFHEYYPHSTDSHAHHHDDSDDDNHEHSMQGSGVQLRKSFSAVNLAAGSPVEDTPFAAPVLGGQETGAGGGHQRWSSVDSNPRYDSDEQQQATAHEQRSSRSSDEAGHYRPASTRSLTSQAKK